MIIISQDARNVRTDLLIVFQYQTERAYKKILNNSRSCMNVMFLAGFGLYTNAVNLSKGRYTIR
jgi:hypothetical protein